MEATKIDEALKRAMYELCPNRVRVIGYSLENWGKKLSDLIQRTRGQIQKGRQSFMSQFVVVTWRP